MPLVSPGGDTSLLVPRLLLIFFPSIAAFSVVVKELLNEVDVREHHATAAVATEAKLVHGISLREIGLQEIEVGLPLIPDYLAAGEASYRDDHN